VKTPLKGAAAIDASKPEDAPALIDASPLKGATKGATSKDATPIKDATTKKDSILKDANTKNSAPPAQEESKKVPSESDIIEIPPKVDSRLFNECDIIGEFDRDEKGNVITNEPGQKDGKYLDNKGQETNERGYLINKTGNVINNFNGKKMFDKKDLDERGEVPAPFNVEKHNFNPHLTRGEFDYDRNGKAIVKKGSTPSGYMDKRGSNVSQRGYRMNDENSMIDNFGRKKFSKE
jgi:hypothetical protein